MFESDLTKSYETRTPMTAAESRERRAAESPRTSRLRYVAPVIACMALSSIAYESVTTDTPSCEGRQEITADKGDALRTIQSDQFPNIEREDLANIPVTVERTTSSGLLQMTSPDTRLWPGDNVILPQTCEE